MKLPKRIITMVFIILGIIVCSWQNVFAIENTFSVKEAEQTEEYKAWLELSEEERKNTIMPRKYVVEPVNFESKNIFTKARLLGTALSPSFSLAETINNNLVIRNQENTYICWAISSLSSLETNLALRNLKNNTNTSKVYDYSERHMEYATSRYFSGNTLNPNGYNRTVGDGGDWLFAESYLTNGMGAVDESSMPFINNQSIIDISQIQGKTVTSQVYDTVDFPNYNNYESEQRLQIISQIKEHIKNYGSVFCSIHGNVQESLSLGCYDDTTGAKFCQDSSHIADHSVSIIGWNDGYNRTNFKGSIKPSQNGAWIVRNSWGTEHGDNGLMYISYEDINVGDGLYGIIKADDKLSYDNIYQYDRYFPVGQCAFEGYSNGITLCNVFDKKTAGQEFLNQISIYAPETYNCSVYVNPEDSSKTNEKMKRVELKSGNTQTINVGYHTLEFKKPIEITGDSFAVAVVVEKSNNEAISVTVVK